MYLQIYCQHTVAVILTTTIIDNNFIIQLSTTDLHIQFLTICEHNWGALKPYAQSVAYLWCRGPEPGRPGQGTEATPPPVGLWPPQWQQGGWQWASIVEILILWWYYETCELGLTKVWQQLITYIKLEKTSLK